MGTCKMCGTCCKVIYLLISPERVEDMAKDVNSIGYFNAKFISENWVPMSKDQAKLLNPFVVSQLEDVEDVKIYYYSCNRLDTKTNLCTTHVSRLPVCIDYPWYGRIPTSTMIWYTPDCGYVNDHEEWVKGQTSEVEAPVEDLKYIKEGVIE